MADETNGSGVTEVKKNSGSKSSTVVKKRGGNSSTVVVVTAVLSSLTSILVAFITSGYLKKTADAATAQVANQNAILGEVRAFGNEEAPPGWMECAGQSLSVKSYKLLFDRIHSHWGALDSDHFNLPDLRGVSLRGWNDGKGENWQDTPTAAKGTDWWDSGAEKRHSIRRNGEMGDHDHVGSYQEDGVGPHTHYVANGMAVNSDNHNSFNEYTSNAAWADDKNAHYTDQNKDIRDGRLNSETTVKNASVMFAIYVGKEAED
jgi:microcystin-dependent protein